MQELSPLECFSSLIVIAASEFEARARKIRERRERDRAEKTLSNSVLKGKEKGVKTERAERSHLKLKLDFFPFIPGF